MVNQYEQKLNKADNFICRCPMPHVT